MVDELRADGNPAGLLPQHLAELRGSGLSDATIAANKFASFISSEKVRQLLDWNGPARKLGPCLGIPYFDAHGKRVPYQRLKPDRPRQGKDGKAVKYEAPKGRPNRLYVPAGVGPALLDPSAPVLITEGEKKSCKAAQEGFACVAVCGVWAWQQKRGRGAGGKAKGPRQLIPDLEAVPWAGRTAYIVFDSDPARKRSVQLAETRLARALARKGAVVRVARLPDGPAGPEGEPGKQGLDDFLIVAGADGLRALLEQAGTPQPREPNKAWRRKTTRTGWHGSSSSSAGTTASTPSSSGARNSTAGTAAPTAAFTTRKSTPN
jgi:putative DNA primase/helicase